MKVRLYRKRSRLLPARVDGITREYFDMLEAAARMPRLREWDGKTARRAAFDVALVSLMRDCLLRRSGSERSRWPTG